MRADLLTRADSSAAGIEAAAPISTGFDIAPDAAPTLAPVNGTARCEQCGGPFRRRTGGGKPQRFCSPSCRMTFHKTRSADDDADADAPGPAGFDVESPVLAAPALVDHADRPARGSSCENFRWDDPDNIVTNEQRKTAVYWNRCNQLVIRQAADRDEERDPLLCFDPRNLPALIERLTAEYWRRRARLR